MEHRGKLELTWVGKYEETAVEPRILVEDTEKSYGDPRSDNMLIHGDNLIALQALQQDFAGRIKCIYIDPPYNTGSAFEHYDDNLEHSIWLSLMRSRLKLLWNLLTPDGSIWISIDDNEEAYLRVMCDELFGRAHFVSNISWQRTYSTRNDAKGIVNEVEHILVYSREEGWQPNRLPRTAEMDKKYKNPDGDVGPWRSSDAYAADANTHQGMVYAIQHPFTGELIYPYVTSHWRYSQEEMLSHKGQSVAGKTAVVSGSGNVALYTIQKLQTLGAKVVTASDSDGYIYDEEGIDFPCLRQIKEVKRGRVRDYLEFHPKAQYFEDEKVWGVPCDMAFPCATQNELSLEHAITLVNNGCKSVTEGANMPTTREATDYLLSAGIDFLPGKAANAGGVAVSALEMSQNASRIYRSFESVDNQLREIMKGIYAQMESACEDYNTPGNYVSGANIAGFRRVVKALRAQGYV